MRYVFVVCLTAACAATPTELRYTATYAYTDAQVGAQILAALQAQKLEVAQVDPRRGAFITLPTALDLTDEVETGFLVTFRRNNESRTKLELTVIVTPKAFERGTDRGLPDDQLPPKAVPRARQLLDAIRASLKDHEAPK